ncbi:MAG: PQQ-dependent sugar dehydrogenase [Planctomycetota bacterium]
MPIRSVLTTLVLAGGCALAGSNARALPEADRNNGGITLPPGFGAVVFAEELGRGRHAVVRDNGDVYVMMRRADGGAVRALRDTDGDGKADRIEAFGEHPGTGIEIHNGWLYLGADDRVLRYKLPEGDALVPTGEPETIVIGFSAAFGHAAKPLTFDAEGRLYVNVGAPSNACQEQQRAPGSPGKDPCPQLESSGGIWRYDADKPGQAHPEDGHRYATGLRHCVALTAHPDTKELFVVVHGRDQLDTLFPEHYTAEQNAELPGEEFHRLEDGFNGGWPYSYWNPLEDRRVISPEYGGDGDKEPEAGKYHDPIQSFPAHWAPNDVIFYTGEQFPERYRGGAFVAFHGSWNRAPMPQEGFNVTFTPFEGGDVAGDFEVFADGFKGAESIRSPRQARSRPTGLAVGPDGHLYIVDSVKGNVWRVFYEGEG